MVLVSLRVMCRPPRRTLGCLGDREQFVTSQNAKREARLAALIFLILAGMSNAGGTIQD
jgi:hypothetical protein